MEECVAAQAARFEILVDTDQVACLPQMHHSMDLIDQRSWPARRRATIAVISHALADAPVPGAEPDFAAGAFRGLAIRIVSSGFAGFFILGFGLAAGLVQYFV